MIDLPVQVSPDSELGQLLAALEAAEADVTAQRMVVATARESYQAAELAQRRGAYALSQSYRRAEDLDAAHARVLELLAARDRDEQQLMPLMDAVRELKQRFGRDYTEFVRLRASMAELKRLAG